MAEDDGITLNDDDYNIKQYSQINCFVAAAAAEMRRNCMRNNTKCLLEYMKQIGRWNFDQGSQKKCMPSCTRSENIAQFIKCLNILMFCRQINHLDISFVKFPNSEFKSSLDFLKVAKKLFWSCYPNTTRFGYRRWRMDLAYPNLCPFYDKYFFNNTIFNNTMFEGMGIV